MLATKLIFTDGCLPGSGKSAVSQLITLQLQKHNIAARWFSEDKDPHLAHVIGAIIQQDSARKGLQEVADVDNRDIEQLLDTMDRDDFAQKSLQAWQSFVDSAQTEEIAVLDSAILQHPLIFLLSCKGVLLNNERADVEWLAAYYDKVQAMLKELAPVLIYLCHDNTAELMHKLQVERGAEWVQWLANVLSRTPYGRQRNYKGIEGVVTMLEFFKDINVNLFSGLTIPKIAIDTSADDWAAYHEQIMDFIGLSWIKDEAGLSQSFDQFVGVYKDSELECTVQLQAGQLTVNNLCEPLARFMPLIPKTANHFFIRSVPVELVFEQLEPGDLWQIRIAGSHEEHSGKVLSKYE